MRREQAAAASVGVARRTLLGIKRSRQLGQPCHLLDVLKFSRSQRPEALPQACVSLVGVTGAGSAFTVEVPLTRVHREPGSDPWRAAHQGS